MVRVGSKMNSFLNGEWAKHGRPGGKRYAAKARRNLRDMNSEEIAELRQTFTNDGYDAFIKEYMPWR